MARLEAEEDIAMIGSSSSSSAASSTGGAPRDAAEEERTDLPYRLDKFNMVDISQGSVWRFADKPTSASEPATANPQAVVQIHSIGRPNGGSSFKATCGRPGHRKCVCWITKNVEGSERMRMLKDLMAWSAGGKGVDMDAHQRSAREVKIAWGMKPRGPG